MSMAGTSARVLSKLQHEKVNKDRALDSILATKTILPPQSAAIMEYYEPLAVLASKIDDRSQLSTVLGALQSDIDHIDAVRQSLLLRGVGRELNESLGRSQQLQGSLERVLRKLSRILSRLTTAHWNYYLTKRNLATLSSKKKPETDGLETEEALPTSIVPDAQKKTDKS
jgi:hypothetical protein